MEFDRFPFFSGIGGQVEWKSEALELCPRFFLMKRIYRNGVFYGMQGNGLQWLM